VNLTEQAAACGISERAFLQRKITGITRPLVATETARTRLRAWVAAGSPAPDFGQLRYVGSSIDLVLPVIATLDRVPPAVAWHVVRAVVVIVLDSVRFRGFAVSAPHSDDAESFVVLAWRGDAASFAETTAHEVSHAWLESYARRSVQLPDAAALHDLLGGRPVGAPGSHSPEYVAAERRADALVDRWGLSVPSNRLRVVGDHAAYQDQEISA
jgi:hypothetical protein